MFSGELGFCIGRYDDVIIVSPKQLVELYFENLLLGSS